VFDEVNIFFILRANENIGTGNYLLLRLTVGEINKASGVQLCENGSS